MASTPRAVPTDTAAAVPSSPALSSRGQGWHNRKKQKRTGGSNNGSDTRSSMCEAPEAKWPGSTAAPDGQLTHASSGAVLQQQTTAFSNSSTHSCDGASRCQESSARCSCDLVSNTIAATGGGKAAVSDGSGDTSSGSQSSNKHSSGATGGSGSRQQRRHVNNSSNAAFGSSQAAAGGGSSGSGDDGDDHGDAWRRRKLPVGRGVHKQQHKQEQQQGQLSEDATALDNDSRQQQAQQQDAAVSKLLNSRSGEPSLVNGYVQGHGPKHSQQHYNVVLQQSDNELQALSMQQAAVEQHGWVSVQVEDLPVLLGTSPDSSPTASHSGNRGARDKGSQLQTTVSMSGIHHSSKSSCVGSSSKEHMQPHPKQLQLQRSRSAEQKQQPTASDMMTAAELASLALTAATNALTVSPEADKSRLRQHYEIVKPQNGRTLQMQPEQLHLEQLQQGKGSALVNGKYSSGKGAPQLQLQEKQRLQQSDAQQQQQQPQVLGTSSNQVPQLHLPHLQQHPQQQQRLQLAGVGSTNGSCPVTPSGHTGSAVSSKGELPACRSPQISPALLEQFGLRVGPLNGSLIPNELQLRAAIEQAGVGAVLVAREDEQGMRVGADELANGSSRDIASKATTQAAGAGSSGSRMSNTTGVGEPGRSSGSGPKPAPAAAGAGCAQYTGAVGSSKGSSGVSSLQHSPHTAATLPAASPTKGSAPSDSSAGSSKGHKTGGNSNSSPRAAGGKHGSRNNQQQQQPASLLPGQLHVQVPDAGVDDCSIASSSSSIQASSSTSNPWQQHESAVAVLQLGAGPTGHHASSGSISARSSHGHGVFGSGLGGLHPPQHYAGSAAGGMSHSSPHLSHHMDQSDIMSDPGTVPGGGFGLGDGFGGGYSRMKPGRNRFMPNHHIGGSAGYYGGGAAAGRHQHHLQDQPLLMQQFANAGSGRGSSGSRRGGGGGSSRDGDGVSSRGAGSGSTRDGEGSGSGRRGAGNSGGRRNSGKDFGLPKSPQLSQGAGGNRRSLDTRGGAYGGGNDAGGRGSGRHTPLPSPGGRSNREQQQRDHNHGNREVRSPHLAGSSSSNSLAGHPSPLLLPEPALSSGPGSGRGGTSSGIAPMQDLPPSAAAAAGFPPHGPSTDLERFLAATGLTVPVNPSMPLQHVLKGLTLKSVWDLFLEPSLWGTPVSTLGGPRGPSTAYYVPYMSAMQLFTTVADPSPTPSPPPAPAPASSTAASGTSNSDGASSRSSSSTGSPTPSSCSGGSSTQSYAAVAAGASPAPSSTSAARSPSAAAAAAASSSVQAGPGGRGRLYTCAVKGWPPVMRLLLEHMELELPFSRDPFYIQLEAMSGGQEAIQAAVASATTAGSFEAASNAENASSPAMAAVAAAAAATATATATGSTAPSAAGNARPTTPVTLGSYTACGYPLVGPDLMTARLLDIHPASWFAVAWYPVYRIPDAPLTARFLTFYSFAQLLEVLNDAVSAANAEPGAPCNLAGLPLPVVGMKWYNLLKERWLELLGTPGNGQQAMVPGGGRRGGNAAAARAAAANNNSSDSDQPSLQLLRMQPARFKEWQARLEDLQVQAGRLSKGAGLKVLTPQGPKEVRLYHSDYEFFNSRP